MRTYFGTFRAASAITKQTAERFRLQTANSTRQIRPVVLPISAFASSAPREIGEFSSAFSAAIAPIRRAQPPLDLTHVFWEGMIRPPRRLIQPFAFSGLAYCSSDHRGVLVATPHEEPLGNVENLLDRLLRALIACHGHLRPCYRDKHTMSGVRVEKGWRQKSPTAVTASLETRPTMDGEPER